MTVPNSYTRMAWPIRTVTIGGHEMNVYPPEHHSRGLCVDLDPIFALAGMSEADGFEFRQTHGMTRPSSGFEVVWTDRPVAVLHRNAALTVLFGRVDDATMAAVEAALSPASA